MSDNKSKRKALSVQVFSGIGMGLLVGIIVGLAVSEVVSIILGALAALLAAFLGLQDQQSSKADQTDKEAAVNRTIMTGIRAGSFGISCVAAILFGIFLRTHNILAKESTLKEQINVWTKAGYDTTEARQYVVFQNLGILPKTMEAVQTATMEMKSKSGITALFASENDVNYCSLLSFANNENSVEKVIEAYKQTKQKPLIDFANKIETNFPIENQEYILRNMERVFCDLQETFNNIKLPGVGEEREDSTIKSLQELLSNL